MASASAQLKAVVVRLEKVEPGRDPPVVWRELRLAQDELRQRWESLGEDDPGELVTRYDSAAEAKDMFEHLVFRHLKSGMKEVSRETVPHAPPPPARQVSHPQLEAACLSAAPDDERPWRVFADWLQDEGDPRGAVAACLLGGDERGGQALLERHLRDLFGPLPPGSLPDVGLRHGFASSLRLRRPNAGSLEALTREVLAAPGARFVTALRFGLAHFSTQNDWGPTLGAVLESRQAGQVRTLAFDDFTTQDSELSWVGFGDFSLLWQGLPALESLHVRAGAGGELGVIEHPRLKRFVRESGGLSRPELDAIVAAKWPALEHLEVWTGAASYGAEASLDRLAPLLEGGSLPRLRSLGVVNSELTLDVLEALVGTALLPRLERLDVSKGVLGDDDLSRLMVLAPKFRHLRQVDFSENQLGDEAVALLSRAWPNARLDAQRTAGGRYVAVGE